MKVLITGATGLIGQHIVSICHERSIAVHYLTTNKHKIKSQANYHGYYWNPKMGEIDANCILGVDAIINLVGASVADRWTKKHKQAISDSRIESAELLAKTLKENEHTIKHIVSASAIGFYPDSLTNYYEEDYDEANTSFLGAVVTKWEHAVDAFESLGLRVSKIRIGLVLAKNGGALLEMAKPIRFGAGAAFGSGNHWQSWIHVEDLAHIFLYILDNKITGIVNGVAPNPVTNRELTKTIANVLHKPLILPNIPKFVMKLLLGDMHVILFSSQRVSAKKIENLGFTFKYHHLQPALENLLQ